MLPGCRKNPPRSPHPDRCDALRREGVSAHYPSLLHVTRKLNKKRHTCSAHQETQLHSVEKTLALGHSRSDQAAGKRRPISAKSHRRPTVDAVVVTELSGSARASYKQSHHDTDVRSTAYRANPRMPRQRVPGRASRRPSWAARKRSNTT